MGATYNYTIIRSPWTFYKEMAADHHTETAITLVPIASGMADILEHRQPFSN